MPELLYVNRVSLGTRAHPFGSRPLWCFPTYLLMTVTQSLESVLTRLVCKTRWSRASGANSGSTTTPLPAFPVFSRLFRWLYSGRLLKQQTVVFMRAKLVLRSNPFSSVMRESVITGQFHDTLRSAAESTVYFRAREDRLSFLAESIRRHFSTKISTDSRRFA